MSLSPSDIAEIDQAVAEATEEIDRLLWVLARLMEKNGNLQGYRDSGALLALAILRLHEARAGGAS